MSTTRKASHEENMVLIIRSTKALPKEQAIKALDDYYNRSGVYFQVTFPTYNLLFEAIDCGNYWAVDWLFNKKKCDPNFLKSKNPLSTPLSAAVQYADNGCNANSEDTLRRRDIIKLLVEKGAKQTPELLNIALTKDNLFYVDCSEAKDANYESLTIAVSKKTDEAIKRIGKHEDIIYIIKKKESLHYWGDSTSPMLLLQCIYEGKVSAVQYILSKYYFSKAKLLKDVVIYRKPCLEALEQALDDKSAVNEHLKSKLCLDAIYEAWNTKTITCEQAIQFYQAFLSAGSRLVDDSLLSKVLENKDIPLSDKTQMLKFLIAQCLPIKRDEILKIEELDDNELLIAALKNIYRKDPQICYDSKAYSESISKGKIEKVKILMKNGCMFNEYKIPLPDSNSEDSRRTQDFISGHRLLLEVLSFPMPTLVEKAKRFIKDMHPADVDDLLMFCIDHRVLTELQAVKPAPLEIPIAPVAPVPPNLIFFPAPGQNQNIESKQDISNVNKKYSV